MEKTQARQSNFELMRIISMFMIVVWHVIIFKSLLSTTTGVMNIVIDALKSLFNVHVNSFILLMGYFQCKKSFKIKKVIQILGNCWFYRFLFIIIFITLGFTSFDVIQFIRETFILPINDDFWFIKCYIVLYCLSPFLNLLIKNISQQQFKHLLVCLFIFFSLLTTLTGQNFISSNQGYSIYSFVVLYFFGAYIKLYPLKESYYFKMISHKKFRLIIIFLFLLCYILNFSFHYLTKEILKGDSPIFSLFFGFFDMAFWAYDNPLVILASIFYFIFFSTLIIKDNKIINLFANSTFGVYLIHENVFIKEVLYNKLLNFGCFENSIILMVSGIFLYAILILVGCSFIDIIKNKIFYLFSKLKKTKENASVFDNIEKYINIDSL